jgi:hypothetical protein
MYYIGILFWASFIIGFILSLVSKHKINYIKLPTDISLINHKFIDTNNKCYIYKPIEIKC